MLKAAGRSVDSLPPGGCPSCRLTGLLLEASTAPVRAAWCGLKCAEQALNAWLCWRTGRAGCGAGSWQAIT